MIKHLSKLFILFCFSAQATTYTWTGTNSSSWTNPVNWDLNNGLFPGATDVALINGAGAGNQPTLSANVTVATLTMSAGSLTLSAFTITVTGTANFTGGTVNTGEVWAKNLAFRNTTFNTLTLAKTGTGSNEKRGHALRYVLCDEPMARRAFNKLPDGEKIRTADDHH